MKSATVQKMKNVTAFKFFLIPILMLTMFACGTIVKPDETVAEKREKYLHSTHFEPLFVSDQWGIEITSLRMSAAGNMIDFRYKVNDPERAAELFKRDNKPFLIHHETGKVLSVPVTAKVGPLRNSNLPKEGRVYWLYFGNKTKLVQSGDLVSITIGDFKAENLYVQ